MNSLGLRLKEIKDILAFSPKIYIGNFKHKFATCETWIHHIILHLPVFKRLINKNRTLFYLLSRLAFYRKKLTGTPYSPDILFSPFLFSSFWRWQAADIPKESLTTDTQQDREHSEPLKSMEMGNPEHLSQLPSIKWRAICKN